MNLYDIYFLILFTLYTHQCAFSILFEDFELGLLQEYDSNPVGLPSTTVKPLTFEPTTYTNLDSVSESERALIVDEHNEGRSLVYPEAINMNIVQWDDELENAATNSTETCKYPSPSKYTHFEAITHMTSFRIHYSVSSWFALGKLYNYYTGACVYPQDYCYAYKLLVWAEMTRMGCGQTYCSQLVDDKANINRTNIWYFKCNFAEVGMYQTGIDPYQTGAQCTGCSSGSGWCRNGLCDSSCTNSDSSCTCEWDPNCNSQGILDQESCRCVCNTSWSDDNCETQMTTDAVTVQNTALTTEESTILTTQSTTDESTILTTQPTTEEPTILTTQSTTDESTILTTHSTTDESTTLTTESTTDESTILTTQSTTDGSTILTTRSTTDESTILTTQPTTDESTIWTTTDESTILTTPSTTDESTIFTTESTTDVSTILTTQSTTDESTILTTQPTTEEPTILTTQPTTVESTILTTHSTTDESTTLTTESKTDESTILTTQSTTDGSTILTTQSTTDESTILTTQYTTDESTILTTQSTTDEWTIWTTPSTTDESTILTTQSTTDESTIFTTMTETLLDEATVVTTLPITEQSDALVLAKIELLADDNIVCDSCNGLLVEKSCTCYCFSGYKGEFCNATCNVDEPNCWTKYVRSGIKYDWDICPKYEPPVECNDGIVCENDGYLDKQSGFESVSNMCRCYCPFPWSGYTCQECNLDCVNGTLNMGNCSCSCDDGYYGPDCSTPCKQTSLFCTRHTEKRCHHKVIRRHCPIMCGICIPVPYTTQGLLP